MADQAKWAETAEAEGSKTLTEFLFRWLGKGASAAKDKVALARATKAYIHRWLDRWGQIKPLGADHPIPLQSIFVQVQAVPRSLLQRFLSVEEMEADLAQQAERGFFPREEDSEPQSGFLIANQHARLNLLGAPGAGKSTFLRRLGLEALLPKEGLGAPRQYEPDVLPVLLELRSLGEGPLDLVAVLAEELAIFDFPESRSVVEHLLKQGRLLVLLDGVDEIPSSRLDDCIKAIVNFTNRFSKNRFVLACRTAFYHDWFRNFTDFVLVDFAPEQIAAYARNWFTRADELCTGAAQAFLDLLNSEDHRATRELAGTPPAPHLPLPHLPAGPTPAQQSRPALQACP